MNGKWTAVETSDLNLTMLEFAAKHDLDPNNIYIKIGKRHYYHFTPPEGTHYIVTEEINGQRYIVHGEEYLNQVERKK